MPGSTWTGFSTTSPRRAPGLATVIGNISGQSRFLIGDGAKSTWAGEIDGFFVWRSALTVDHAESLAQHSTYPIPEPSMALLLSLGLMGLALRRSTLP